MRIIYALGLLISVPFHLFVFIVSSFYLFSKNNPEKNKSQSGQIFRPMIIIGCECL